MLGTVVALSTAAVSFAEASSAFNSAWIVGTVRMLAVTFAVLWQTLILHQRTSEPSVGNALAIALSATLTDGRGGARAQQRWQPAVVTVVAPTSQWGRTACSSAGGGGGGCEPADRRHRPERLPRRAVVTAAVLLRPQTRSHAGTPGPYSEFCETTVPLM